MDEEDQEEPAYGDIFKHENLRFMTGRKAVGFGNPIIYHKVISQLKELDENNKNNFFSSD